LYNENLNQNKKISKKSLCPKDYNTEYSIICLIQNAKKIPKFQNNNIETQMPQNPPNLKITNFNILGIEISIPKNYLFWFFTVANIMFLFALVALLIPNFLTNVGNRDTIFNFFGKDFTLARYTAYMTAIQSIATLFALVGVFIAAMSYHSQNKLQIKTMEAENRPFFTLYPINNNIGQEKAHKFSEGYAKISGYNYRKVFDISLANKPHVHPLFIIKNTGNNFAENVEITISGGTMINSKIDFTTDNCIKEATIKIVEKNKTAFVRKDSNYKSASFDFEESFGIQIKYESSILGKQYIDEYQANVGTGIINFCIKKNGHINKCISDRSITLKEDKSNEDSYNKLKLLWEDHVSKNKSNNYMKQGGNIYKYLTLLDDDIDILEHTIDGKEAVFIQKKGSYILGFTNILSEVNPK
jgi:hypothetical protein